MLQHGDGRAIGVSARKALFELSGVILAQQINPLTQKTPIGEAEHCLSNYRGSLQFWGAVHFEPAGRIGSWDSAPSALPQLLPPPPMATGLLAAAQQQPLLACGVVCRAVGSRSRTLLATVRVRAASRAGHR